MLASRVAPLVYTGLFGFFCAAMLTLSRGWPALPTIHDESSFLLAADTFAHGRLTNPAPPLAEHFETFHVLVRPSYASKYPPAQGLMLALGQVLTGSPIVGVWLSAGLLAATLTWMLRAWFRTSWAVWGSVLITLLLAGSIRDGYWLATFWGGTVAAIGAALVYGAARRLTRTPSALSAILFALGLGILALSRPFEGLLVSIPPIVSVGAWLLRDRSSTSAWRMTHVFAPLAVVIAAIGGFALYYNARVTGNPLRMPYAEYEAQYGSVPLFVFAPRSAVRTIDYANREMRRFYADPVAQRSMNTPLMFLRAQVGRVIRIHRFLAPGMILVLALLGVIGNAWRRLAMPLAGTGLVLAGSFLVTWYWPHYIAPVIAPWAILLTNGARRLALLKPRRIGLCILWLVFATTAANAIVTTLNSYAARTRRPSQWPVQRYSIERALERQGGRHLVIVSYGPKHSFHNEWVHNRANFTTAPVIWARSLSPTKDSLLIQHFRDRVAWRLDVDTDSTHSPLRPTAEPTTSELLQR
ncbi:MAG TPA: hypothetical protein VGQ52_19655 [Gemmatimonadaceae bacterium]|nr:hypothetical protein [Gemmatimonadaceae bacterium]